ncbi:MAG TPA: acyltransferase family protein [Candidatus Sulfotelmatobacter sp.]|nr:acyltransferase family protein [Candidatus Sulfotelmatobacter sp.]
MPADHNQSHRTDIDGLRALAILPVLLYHARLGCSGGYVGVDIFFVISGYLITSLILREQAEGVFSLTGFWERRVRRILPAAALVMAATFLVTWFMFLPEDFKLVAGSAGAQAVMLSNVFFNRQMLEGNGYFGPAADTMPLLHTWSLSVEEQFYLFFPVLMIVAPKGRMFLRIVVVLGALSFVMSVWYLVPKFIDPFRSTTHGAFFLLSSRAWELLLGALLALTRGKQVPDKGARELVGWLGVGLVGYAVLRYDDKTIFPGAAAIPPCLGAALIIFSNEGELCSVGRLLSFKPVVFIGLISYSLYLWHWPLLLFDEYSAAVKPGPWRRAAVLAISFILATLSWRYVETPFRMRKVLPKRRFLFAFAGCTTAVFLALGFWMYSTGGMPGRLSPVVYRYAEFRNDYAFRDPVGPLQVQHGQVVELGFTNSTPFDLLVWGDSHAMAVAPVINDLCRKYSLHGALTADLAVPPVAFARNDLASAVLDLIRQRHIKTVIMAARWSYYTPMPGFKVSLIYTVQTALRCGARVYVLKDVPHPGFDVPRLVTIKAMHGMDLSRLGTSPLAYSELNKPMDEIFNQLSKMGATMLDPTPYFVTSPGLFGVVKDDKVLYWDDDHLTVEGADVLAPMFEPIFRTITVRSSHYEGKL